MEETKTTHTATCQRCGYAWNPRLATPVKCPRCQNHNWQTPARVKNEKSPAEAPATTFDGRPLDIGIGDNWHVPVVFRGGVAKYKLHIAGEANGKQRCTRCGALLASQEDSSYWQAGALVASRKGWGMQAVSESIAAGIRPCGKQATEHTGEQAPENEAQEVQHGEPH